MSNRWNYISRWFYYKDKDPEFVYNDLQDFENALINYNGSFDSDNKPWSDLIQIGKIKYLLTEYGGMDKSYMIFTNLNDKDDYFTVNYNPVRTGKDYKKPFEFYSID